MARNDVTSSMIDGLLRFMVGGGLLTTALLAPNAIKLWDKPARQLFKQLDARAQQREYRRLIRYMRSQGLIKSSTIGYAHGLQLTPSGRKRAEKADIENITVPHPKKWDGSWRIIFFDIPETYKAKRDHFSRRLRLAGFEQLQRSVWVHPFPCRELVEAIALAYQVDRYVTYIETSYIDAADQLRARFATIIKRA